jgi:hypothetical protein
LADFVLSLTENSPYNVYSKAPKPVKKSLDIRHNRQTTGGMCVVPSKTHIPNRPAFAAYSELYENKKQGEKT